MRGLEVCGSHGGRTPVAKAAGLRRLEERRRETELGRALADLQEEVAARGVEAALLDQVWRAAGRAYLLEVEAGGELTGERATELRHWTVEAARLAKLALDAGFQRWQVEMAEGTAKVLATVMRDVTGWVLEQWRAGRSLDEVEVELPGQLRRAIEGARVIDVSETTGG